MASTNEIPKHVGDFEILSELGRGGMGVVYEARQKSLNRRIALKVLSSGLGLTSKAVMRFRREAEAAAKLHHTNIVPIYSTGEENGVHYYAMELIEGPSLDHVLRHMRDGRDSKAEADEDKSASEPASDEIPDWVNETIAYERPSTSSAPSSDPMSSNTLSGSSIASGTKYFDTVATMIAEAADALQHAHDNGVIHRDVKPANLLLAPDGRLSINDFGLARVLEQPGMTMSGEFVGSPFYMSPEQIMAGRVPLDHRTDIYSLGATLFELLTLQPPFPGKGRDEVMTKIMHKEPSRPRRLNKTVPMDLETITLKALEKDPDRRYQTAGQVAADLRRFVDRFAISARRVGVVGRIVKWTHRHPALTVSYSAVALLLVLFLTTSFMYWRAELDRAKENTIDSAMSGQFDEARQHLGQVRRLWGSKGWVHMLEGQIAMQEGNYAEADQSLREACRLMPESTAAYSMLMIVHFLRGDEDEYIRSLPTLKKREAATFYDRLFKGYAETWFLQDRALVDLKSAVDERPGNQAARALYARALFMSGIAEPSIDKGSELAREGLRQLDGVRQYWEDTPWLLGDYINANVALMLMSRELGNSADEQAYLQSAQDGVRRLLAKFPDSHAETNAAMHFFGATDQGRRLHDEVKMRLDRGDELGGYTGITAAIHLYRIGESKLALDAFRHAPPEVLRVSEWGPVIVRMEDEDRRKLLNGYVKVVNSRIKEPSLLLVLDWPVLRLLGLPKSDPRAKRAADGLGAAYSQLIEDKAGGQFGAKLAQYMRGECDKNELLTAASSHRGMLAYAQFIIGVDYLAEGDRVSAREHFQASVDTNFFLYYAHGWSLAFLQRIDDPSWLPWLNLDDEKESL